MALALNDRVQQQGTANTTVSFTLTSLVTGFQSFAVIGNGNTTYYSATDATGNFEVGIGTYSTTGPTLTRNTILSSSNSNTAVTFVGTVNVFVTYPSSKSVNLDSSSNVSALGTISSGTWNGSTIGVAYGGTGVTTSSGANSVMLRDANQNVAVNRLNQSNTNTSAAGGVTALTTASMPRKLNPCPAFRSSLMTLETSFITALSAEKISLICSSMHQWLIAARAAFDRR